VSKACLASFQPTAQNPLQSSLQQVPEEVQRDTQASEPLPSPCNPSQVFQQRSTATRSFLADGFTNLRRRASSGPANLTDNIRKLIADLPVMSLPKNSSFTNLNFGREDSTAGQVTRPRRSTPLYTEGNLSSSESPQSPTGGTPSRPSTCLARIPTATVETPHQPLLRRSTSDNSLYLTRGLSHTTTLDDTTKWEHVSEQVNSRFKAISDNLVRLST
jgi:hypothetical protein